MSRIPGQRTIQIVMRALRLTCSSGFLADIKQKYSTRFCLSMTAFGLAIAMTFWGCCNSSQTAIDASIAPDRCEDPIVQIHEPYRIEVIGSNFAWHVKYPDHSGSREVRNIHCPEQTQIVLVLNSSDYVYTFSIPQFGVNEIALPTLEFRKEFQTSNAGEFELNGNEMCGLPHDQLNGLLIVEPKDKFVRWLAETF